MNEKAIRAWKDAAYRESLTDAEREALPENPAGAIELSDDDLAEVSGGASFLSFCRTVCGVYCSITNDFDCLGT